MVIKVISYYIYDIAGASIKKNTTEYLPKY
jgi:hypothetical protein